MKKIDQLYKEDKPREKLLKKGAAALKDHELLALLLGSGIPGKDVLKLSMEALKIIRRDPENFTPRDLLDIKGLGRAKAAQIVAAFELSRRFYISEKIKITQAADVWEVLSDYRNKKQEYFIAITLDGASSMIEKRVISIGTLNQSLVHPREVFSDAVSDRAAGVIVAHNHPSGQLFPSREDHRVTRRLKEAGAILGIELLDHVIIGNEGWYSFSEEGQI